jgi:hypothetical protein
MSSDPEVDLDRLWTFQDVFEEDEERAGDEGKEGEARTTDEYALRGDPPFYQVEPEASYWARCRFLCTVTREDVRRHIDTIYSYPAPGSDVERRELAEIRDLQAHAHDATYFDREYRPRLSIFLQNPRFIERPPEGAVLNRRGGSGRPGTPILKYGAELATLFEAETPGLWHRHVFNIILDSPVNPQDPKHGLQPDSHSHGMPWIPQSIARSMRSGITSGSPPD